MDCDNRQNRSERWRDASPDEDSSSAMHRLVLVKHGQQYVFQYAPGDESRMLAGLVKLVHDPDSDLDWFDAAVLSHQIGLRMGQQMRHRSL
jgi:hypothetical protein